MKRIVVLGAGSAIAQAACRLWAVEQARFILVGRESAHLEAIAADLKARGAAGAEPLLLDCAMEGAPDALAEMECGLGGLDIVLLAYAVLPVQRDLENDPAALADVIRTNFTSAAAWIAAASGVLERQGSGTLLVLGSVAGDRPRGGNIVYGATKAGLAGLVGAVAHRLAPSGARAVLIKPGFVDTPMTDAAGRRGLLWAAPETVAAAIVKAARRGGPVVYVPSYWRPIMFVVRHLPAALFNRIKP